MSDPELLTYQPIAVALPGPAEAGAPAVIDLPPPDLGAGLPLMSALSLRASTREFSSAALAPTTLGELLGPPTASTAPRRAAAPHRPRMRSTRSTSMPRCPTASIATTRRCTACC